MFGINKKLKIHFIGIGGIGMSGIANILNNLGYNVSGSDINDGANVKTLRNQGVEIFIGHKEDNVKDAQLVVYSSAVNYQNPEVKKAMELKIPIVKRAEMLAELMRLKYGVAIAGSHGKTTTTSFVSTIFQNLDLKPTCIVGGIVKNLGSQSVKGDSEFLIAEADESDGSFLYLNPIMSVITNIDNDHLDYYQNQENIKKAFTDFSNKIPFYGCVALNGNDKNSIDILKDIRRPSIVYGIEGKEKYFEIDYLAKDISHNEDNSTFTLCFKNEEHIVKISLSGDHNVSNALAAIAISHKCGVSLSDAATAITNFHGVGRRFENLYQDNNMVIIDDYGHHPTEINATLKTARVKYPNHKIIAIFEPHRYSRTKEFWNEFVDCFHDVDQAYISPIYPASEEPIEYIDSEILVKNINEKYSNCSYIKSFDELENIFKKYENQKSIILTLGAGSISKVTRDAIDKWKA